MLIDVVCGARPNFVKVASVLNAIKKKQESSFKNLRYRIVHTGQHYDKNLSDSFFEQLNIPRPSVNFNVGSSSHAQQTAAIMTAYEDLLLKRKPNVCTVVGDVNSTIACALAAKKMNVKVAHVEAGLRSFDMSMPEEINRILTDRISDIFFTTTEHANENLIREGVDRSKIHLVGNTMIDTLLVNQDRTIPPGGFKTKGKPFFVMTLHRPSNVDNREELESFISLISKVEKKIAIIFPVHPRTREALTSANYLPKNFILMDPLPYLEFSWLLRNCLGIITDSGGVTEEATFFKKPCITIRENTERPETIDIGSNVLAKKELNVISKLIQQMKDGAWKKSAVPDFWDGKAGERIVEVFLKNGI
tara:strand:+ start:74 stop:1159 length:1086 start_codon:yes stop_codon:yes gene_type:complete